MSIWNGEILYSEHFKTAIYLAKYIALNDIFEHTNLFQITNNKLKTNSLTHIINKGSHSQCNTN